MREIWKEGRRGGNIRALRGEGGNRGEGKYENFERGRWKRVEKFVILDNKKSAHARDKSSCVFFETGIFLLFHAHSTRDFFIWRLLALGICL